MQIPASERLQWYRCLSPGDATLEIPIDCLAISQAQKNTYVPTRKDIKSFLRLGTLISVGGTPQMRFSATTPRISAIWTTISTVERSANVAIAELVGSASKGKITTRVVTGPCKIVKKVLVPTGDGQCILRIVADAKAPYRRLTQTVVLEIVTKNEATT